MLSLDPSDAPQIRTPCRAGLHQIVGSHVQVIKLPCVAPSNCLSKTIRTLSVAFPLLMHIMVRTAARARAEKSEYKKVHCLV